MMRLPPISAIFQGMEAGGQHSHGGNAVGAQKQQAAGWAEATARPEERESDEIHAKLRWTSDEDTKCPVHPETEVTIMHTTTHISFCPPRPRLAKPR